MEPGSVKKIPYITKHQICRTPFDAYTFWAHHKCIRLLSQALYGSFDSKGAFFFRNSTFRSGEILKKA